MSSVNAEAVPAISENISKPEPMQTESGESTSAIFRRLLTTKSNKDERRKWAEENPNFRCSECMNNLQTTCTPHTEKSIRCSFCQGRKKYCSRTFAERQARVKRLMKLDDQQFNELHEQLEKAGFNFRGAGYGQRRTRKKMAGPSAPSGGTPSASTPTRRPGRPHKDKASKTQSAPAPKDQHRSRKVVVEVRRPASTVTGKKLENLKEELVRTREELEQTQEELAEAKESINTYKTEQTNITRRNIAEHTNLNVLKTRLRRATESFDDRNMTRGVMIDTCRNLCEQLQEIADRHLDNVPVGFSDIMDAMVVAAEDEDQESGEQRGPAQKRRKLGQ